MTEQQNADSGTKETPTAPEAADDTNGTQEGTQDAREAGTGTDDSGGNREAARYRKRLRQTEAERDQLRERVVAMQRAEVERLAADRLATPADLWMVTPELSALLDDDGAAVDPDKVNATVDQVLADRPGWQRSTAPGYDGGARTTAAPAPTWQQILQGGRRR